MYDYRDIRKVHLEISTRCNAACPGCPRNLCGVDIIDDFPLHDMSLLEAQQIFTPEFLAQLDLIHINGNLGDFVTARDGVAIAEYFRSQNPTLEITISTNAGIPADYWPRLAELGVKIYFCLDGLAGTHELYRQQTKWDTVIANAAQFIAAGGHAVWKMIKFDHNIEEETRCRELALTMGFKSFEFVDHGRNAFPAFDQKGRFRHHIGSHDQPIAFEKVMWIHFEGMGNEYPIPESKKINCEVKSERSVYIAATGEVFPCCWLGFYPQQMYHRDNPRIAEMITNNNALQVGVAGAVGWFNAVEKSWDGAQLSACNSYCGV